MRRCCVNAPDGRPTLGGRARETREGAWPECGSVRTSRTRETYRLRSFVRASRSCTSACTGRGTCGTTLSRRSCRPRAQLWRRLSRSLPSSCSQPVRTTRSCRAPSRVRGDRSSSPRCSCWPSSTLGAGNPGAVSSRIRRLLRIPKRRGRSRMLPQFPNLPPSSWVRSPWEQPKRSPLRSLRPMRWPTRWRSKPSRWSGSWSPWSSSTHRRTLRFRISCTPRGEERERGERGDAGTCPAAYLNCCVPVTTWPSAIPGNVSSTVCPSRPVTRSARPFGWRPTPFCAMK